MVSHIKLSNWGLVYYNNGIGTLMSILVFLLTDEAGMRRAPTAAAAADQAADASRRLLVLGDEASSSETSLALTGIAMSCVFGVGIRRAPRAHCAPHARPRSHSPSAPPSFFGFSVRRKITATGFTVLGCTNKLITMAVNIMVWEHHASWGGQVCLLVCIAGGVLYGELSQRDSEAKKAAAAAAGALKGVGVGAVVGGI